MSPGEPFCVCIPARNEAERLPRLIEALAAQDHAGVVPVIIALNNTTDRSRDLLAELSRRYQDRLELVVDDTTFEAGRAHAGAARRRAMDLGAERLEHGGRGVLLTTDADARPPETWVSANLKAMARGVDVVGGRLFLDDDEPIAERVWSGWMTLSAYWSEVRRIEDEIDPVAWDPPPRHGDHTGGSLAVTLEAYRAVGGVPELPIGEDAAFVSAARRAGFRLAHPMTVWTRVSPRATARAAGGMAATMEALADPRSAALAVPSLDEWRARARWRRSVRLEGGDARVATLEADLPPMQCDTYVVPPLAEGAA